MTRGTSLLSNFLTTLFSISGVTMKGATPSEFRFPFSSSPTSCFSLSTLVTVPAGWSWFSMVGSSWSSLPFLLNLEKKPILQNWKGRIVVAVKTVHGYIKPQIRDHHLDRSYHNKQYQNTQKSKANEQSKRKIENEGVRILIYRHLPTWSHRSKQRFHLDARWLTEIRQEEDHFSTHPSIAERYPVYPAQRTRFGDDHLGGKNWHDICNVIQKWYGSEGVVAWMLWDLFCDLVYFLTVDVGHLSTF